MKALLLPLLAGLIVGGGATYTFLEQTSHHNHFTLDGTHPIGYADNEDEVHVHSDFLMVINGERVDFSADRYQTTSEQELHESIHLHDNNPDVIHRHADDITLGEFFGSLGFTLTNDCLTTDTDNTLCSNDQNELLVFVNDERISNPAEYVNQEEDRILIYYGDPSDEVLIRESLVAITDKACIYSGTCPERGTPPPESCGLSCDL